MISMKKKQIRCLTATVVIVCLVLLCFGIYVIDAKTIEQTEQSLEEIENIVSEWKESNDENRITEVIGMSKASIQNTIDVEAIKKAAEETEKVTDSENALKNLRKNLPEKAKYKVKHIKQYPELPTGCESVSLTMALNYYGFDLKKTDIADDYLIYDAESFLTGYMGDPYTETGAGIYPPGLAETANDFLKSEKSKMKAYNLLGTEFEELYAYVAAGYPVLLWTTISYEDPVFEEGNVEYKGEVYNWFADEHCVVFTGYDLENEVVQLADPLKGEVEVDIDTIQAIYDEIGQPALVIY